MKNVITIAVMALALVATSFVSSPAQADNFGAIAYSPSTGASGRSWDYPSRAGAENAALNNCYQHAGDCQVLWFANACGAVAVGRGGGWGNGWGANKRAATRAAVNKCRQYTSNCKVRVWQCTTR